MANVLASSSASASSRCAAGRGRQQQQRAGRRVPMAPRAGLCVEELPRLSRFLLCKPRPSSLAPRLVRPFSLLRSTRNVRDLRLRQRDRREDDSLRSNRGRGFRDRKSRSERKKALSFFLDPYLLCPFHSSSRSRLLLPHSINKKKTIHLYRSRDRRAAPRARLLLRKRRQGAPHRRPRLPPLPDKDGPLRAQPGQ